MTEPRLERLTAALGRAPRVLHIGNVANNAYLNAALLNAHGIESDVLCHGNYHFMASPEWEELDELREPIADVERPDWNRVAPTRYDRPRWFAQGPFDLAARYLEARRGGAARAGVLWQALELRRQLTASGAWRFLRKARPTGTAVAAPPAPPVMPPAPDRDIADYERARAWTVAVMQRLGRHYDVVHAYGAEPILPLGAGVHPYVAWEHGTIRRLPFEPTLEGRLIARSYQAADAVVITNADTRASAERLGITKHRFIPHPINERKPEPDTVAATRARLRASLDADFIVFHPSRQHWSPERQPTFEKGNDYLIEGLAKFFAARPRAGAVFVEWGASVKASRDLLSARGIADRVSWIPPQTGMSLARHMMAADVTADQFYLGAFGSTMPRALWLGCPSLIYLDPAAHAWCLPELPPLINARAPEEIAAGLLWAYDNPAARQELAVQGRRWYDAHHSSRVLLQSLTTLYGDVIGGVQ